MNKIILVTGSRRAGKDTFFNLINQLNSKCQRFAFADELKAALTTLVHKEFGLDVYNVSDKDKEIVLLFAF
jgi:predicted AAA+ superfamily ATPase